jgi:hypothetical protein
MNRSLPLTIALTMLIAGVAPATAAELKRATPAGLESGAIITKANAAKIASLVSPGNYVLVSQGMEMKIVPARDYNWPPPFRVSTEQDSSQVRLGPHGELTNYLAGLPFPILDANDPSIAQKIMWNFQFGPAYSDDLDSQDTEIQNFTPGGGNPFAVYPIGHLAVYRNLGREEVAPAPTDYDGDTGIMERMALGPIIVPIEPPFWQSPWAYMVRYRYSSPKRSDLIWSDLSVPTHWYGQFPGIGNSDYLLGNAFFGNLDLDSLFGFAGRFQDFDFKFLGEKEMLAVVHAKYLPARQCAADGGRTICPEDWELRHVYVVEADARRPGRFADIPAIAKRILYIDSQGWFITASDQYDHDDKLWKTLAIFNTVRDREYPDSKAAVYSFDRLFQTALVDEDVQSGYSTIFFTPSPERPQHDTWFINQGIISQRWIIPQRFTTHREYFY